MARLLILTHEYPPFRGGVATYTRELARAAARIGHTPTVVAPDHGDSTCDDRAERFPVHRFRGSGFDRSALAPLLGRTWSLVRAGGYDVIHAIDWPHILALSMINRVRRVPFVATAFGTEILGPARSRLAWALGARDFFAKPTKILAISQFTRDLLFEHFPSVEPSRVEITPLGVSPFWSEPAADPEGARARLGVPPGHRVVLTVARLDPRKGHRSALRALARLPGSLRASLTYLIVGRGGDERYNQELRALAETSGTHVVFAEAVGDDDLRALYRGADVFLLSGEPHPERVEGFGLVFLEAASQGLPSIAAEVGACAEVVLDGLTGLVVPPRDENALADALVRLLSDEPLRIRLGREARARAACFTWERCAELTYGPPEGAAELPSGRQVRVLQPA